MLPVSRSAARRRGNRNPSQHDLPAEPLSGCDQLAPSRRGHWGEVSNQRSNPIELSMPYNKLSAEVLAELDLTIEHFNANHADTVLFLAKYAGGCMNATDAEARHIDALGVELSVMSQGESGIARLDFTESVSTTLEVQSQLIAKIALARTAAGDGVAITSLEREREVAASLPTFALSVASARNLTPHLREIVVEGDLEGFVSHRGDQFVLVMVPRSSAEQIPDGYTMADYRAADPNDQPLGGYYTIQSWDQDAGRITLWVVLHGHGAGVGGWAARAVTGDRIALWGPREGFGVRQSATSHLFVTDESGFAAVSAMLADISNDATVTIIAETVDAEHVVDLGASDGTKLIWLFRGDSEPGTGGRLLDAVRALELETNSTGIDGLVAFGAAESKQISDVRKYLRHELGMAADSVSMTGYWRLAT